MRLAKVLTLGLGLAAILAARAGAQEVAGTVTDARNGKPIEGARVSVANVGTVRSDARGRFRIGNLPGSQVTLSVAQIGYRPAEQTARVGDQEVKIELTEQAVNLGEIIVTGTAGGAEKRSVGNSVTTVRTADVQELAPASDIAGLLNNPNIGS